MGELLHFLAGRRLLSQSAAGCFARLPNVVSIGLLISIYTIVRLIQIPFECSGACGVPFAGLHVRTRVWIVTGLSVLGVIGLCLVTSTLILEAIHMLGQLGETSAELQDSVDAVGENSRKLLEN